MESFQRTDNDDFENETSSYSVVPGTFGAIGQRLTRFNRSSRAEFCCMRVIILTDRFWKYACSFFSAFSFLSLSDPPPPPSRIWMLACLSVAQLSASLFRQVDLFHFVASPVPPKKKKIRTKISLLEAVVAFISSFFHNTCAS